MSDPTEDLDRLLEAADGECNVDGVPCFNRKPGLPRQWCSACLRAALVSAVRALRLKNERQRCDKCGKEVPLAFLAIEVEDGHPIDDPAGFQWCIVCHCRRVDEGRKKRIEQADAEIAALRAQLQKFEALAADLVVRAREQQTTITTLQQEIIRLTGGMYGNKS